MRILIAEDDSIISDGLARSASAERLRRRLRFTTESKPTTLVAGTYDLLILDIGLPKLTGHEVLKRLRARNSQLPVLILTALDGTSDRVRGLTWAPTTTWPNRSNWLNFRSPRPGPHPPPSGTTPVIQCGELTYDQVGRVAQIKGQPVELSAREVGCWKYSWRGPADWSTRISSWITCAAGERK